MADIFDWSTSAGSNNTIDGVNVAENCPPGGINNAIRGMAALIRNTFSSALQSFLAGTAPLPVANGGTGGATASAARAALGAAASGANADILSLAGLTTALSIAQGGTGGNTADAAIAALGAQKAISFGTGGDGQYLGIRVGSVTYYVMWGTKTGYFYQGPWTITLPVTLTSAASISAQVTAGNTAGGSGTSYDCWAQIKSASTTVITFMIQDSSGSASADSAHWFAIGY